MALDVTVSLTDAQEAELTKMTADVNNAAIPPTTLNPTQFLRRFVRDWITASAQIRDDQAKLTLRSAYKAAPADVQTQIDTLLAPYR